jgi:FtsP/CotA-like multicopper oxidase with cupredoxin domain
MFKLDPAVKRALELRKELSAAKFGRRELAKLGLVAGSVHYGRGSLLRQALAGDVPAIKLTSWKDPLPIPPKVERRGGDGYQHDDFQWCDKYAAADTDVYRLEIEEHKHRFHSELEESEVWSFEKTFGGPVLDVRYGQPFCLHIINKLRKDHVGYGSPDTTSHLHNFHTATESDGGPWNMLQPDGGERYQHYCMARAGFADPLGGANPHYKDTTGLAPNGSWWSDDNGRGDLRETLTTLFMHDHRPEFTSPNLYKGLFMMVRAFDEMDTGNETTGWRLPSGQYDVPLMFQDKQIVPDTGEMTYNQFAVDGFLGNYQTVNGAYQPYFEVEPRAYRFRLLDGGPSRFYRFVLRTGGRNVKFHQITESGNLLYVPRKDLEVLDLWVAERSDIIVDFSGMTDGTAVILSNTLSMRADGRGEEIGKVLNPDDPANQLLKFVVRRKQDSYPKFTLPARFRPLPPLPDISKLPRKEFKFERKNGQWAINGKFWDADSDHADAEKGIAPLYQVKRDSAEIWTLDSSSGGWDHPMHIHFEEGQIISSNGTAIAEAKRHRYDIYRLRQNKIDVMLRFRDFPQTGYTPPNRSNQTDDYGRYVMHCHNVTHEDHSMMATWSIKP